ncbi:MAG: tetratricopeptide repeat protein [Deltaproteobacteria bacterium]|nr:tetratricopeptide repeat protein [Deltaproteobacteria bacterium]
MAHKNLGYIYVKQGKLDLAIPPLEKAIKIAPDDVHLHLTLARSYLEAAEIEQLVAVCDKILHLLDIPASLVLDSISQLANAQRLLDRQDLACFDLAFDVAKLLGPADADRLKSLARSASLYNEYNRAAGILETALILNPKDPEVMELIKGQIKRLQH